MDQPHTLADWLTYLETLHPATIALGLERVSAVRERLGLATPFVVINVGGTNGKGSTCAMLEAILHAAGYRVGCYTSPHLVRYNERVRVAREEVSDAQLCAAFARVENMRGNIELTYFEMGTLAAVALFADAKVDVAILEIGLGGRLDAVNIFDPDCAILTGVDIDHTDYLGATRDSIGFEKAHIFRSGIAAICAEPDPPQSVIAHAQMIGADFLQIGRDFGFSVQGAQWDFFFCDRRRSGLPLPALRGVYQLGNAAAAVAALESLSRRLPITQQDVRGGLTQVRLPARFQALPGRPAIILDVAHNAQAARALANNLRALPPARTLAVFAILKDKEVKNVIDAIDPMIDEWHVAAAPSPRSAAPEELAALIPAEKCTTHPDITAAWDAACEKARENDRIVVFGSFFTVAGVMAAKSAS